MVEPHTIGVLLLGPLRTFAVTLGVRLATKWWTSSETEKAITRVDKEFLASGTEGIAGHIKSWLETAVVQERLVILREGCPPSEDDVKSLITSLDVSALYTGSPKSSTTLAEQVLARFFVALHEEYLKAADGHVYQTQHLDAKLDIILGAVQEIRPYPQILVRAEAMGTPISDSQIDATVLRDYDIVQGLIQDGNASSALRWLDRRKTSQGDSPSIDEKYQWYATKGNALLQQNEFQAALECFESAERLKPDRANARANTALGLMLAGHLDQAIAKADQVLSSESDHPTAIKAKAQALPKLLRFEESLTLAARMENDQERHYLLGVLYLNAHRLDEAIKHLSTAHEVSKSAEITYRLSQAHLGRFQAAVDCAGLTPWDNFPPEIASDLERGTKLLSEAIEAAAKTENRVAVGAMLLSKATLLACQKEPEALEVFEEARRHGAHDANAVTAIALLAMETGDPDRALKILEDPRTLQNDNLIRLRVHLLESREDHDLALELLGRQDVIGLLGDRRCRIARAECLLDKGDSEEAASVLEELPEDRQDWEAAIVISRLRSIQGKTDEAVRILQAAIDNAKPAVSWRLKLTLAQLCSSMERWEQAANIFGHLLTPRSPVELLRKHLVALYYSDRLPEFFALAKDIRSERGTLPACAGLEAQVLAHLGRLPEADVIFEELMHVDPDNGAWPYERASLAYRQGDAESARRLLPTPTAASQLDVLVAMTVAGLRAELGEYGDALETAYLALKRNPDRADAHLRYVGLCLTMPEEECKRLEPTEATEGSFVLIEDGEAKREIEIIGRNQGKAERDQVAVSDAFGQQLVGAKPGDIVRVREDNFGVQEVRVLTVSSKYSALCREVLDRFHTRFPGEAGLRRFHVKGMDFKFFFEALDRRAEWVEHLKRGYQEQDIPISTLAKIAHEHEISIWYALIQGHFGRVYTGPGTPSSREVMAETEGLGRALVLDPTSLCAMQELRLLQELPKLGVKLLVAQSAVDILDEARRERRQPVAMVAGRQGNEYFRQDVTQEDRDRAERAFESTLTWVREHCETKGVVVPNGLAYRRMTDVLLPASADSVVIALQESAVLVTEDLRLRKYGATEHSIAGCAALDLARRLMQEGLMEPDRYDEIVVRLASWNYFFVSVSPTVLRAALRMDDWRPGGHLAAVLETLKDPGTTDSTIAPVLAQFVKLIWRENALLEDPRRIALLSCFDVLLARPVYRRVRDQFLAVLRHQFRIDYFGLRDIEAMLRLWSQMHFLPV